MLILASVGCGRNGGRDRLLEQGNQFFEHRQYAQASVFYAKAAKADPRFGQTYYRLGLSEMRLQHLQPAWAAFSRALDLQPSDGEAAAQLAEVSLMIYQAGHSPTAYRQIDSVAARLLARNPNSFSALRLRGYQAVADARPERALEFFQKANLVQPLTPDVTTAMVQSLFVMSHAEEGERLARQLIAAHPQFGPIYDTLYSYYQQNGRTAESEQILVAKVTNNPGDPFPLMQLAQYYWQRKQSDDATRTIRRLLEHPQTYPRAYESASTFFQQTGQWDQAVQALEAGAAADPAQKLNYQKHVVESLLRQGKAATALNRLAGLIAEFPADDDLKGTQATLLVDSSRMEDRGLAVRQLEELIRRAPDNLTFHYQLGRAYSGVNRDPEARQQFTLVAARDPNHVLARMGLAEMASRSMDFQTALRWVQEVLRLSPDLRSARLLRATALVGLGRLNEARIEYRSLLSRYPQYREAQLQSALLDVVQKRYAEAETGFRASYEPEKGDFRALKGLVELYAAERQPEQASALLQKELTRYPHSADLRTLQAEWAGRLGHWDRAAREYEILSAERPQDPGVLLRLGEAYQQLGNWQQAAAVLERAETLQPNDCRTLVLLGYIRQEQGSTQEAEQQYRNCLRLNPNSSDALNNLASLLAEQPSRLDDALSFAQKASRVGQGSPQTLDTIGWIYVKKGRLDAAEEVFARLAKTHPREAMVRYHFGLVLQRKGEHADARRELQAALRAGLPRNEQLQAAQLLSGN